MGWEKAGFQPCESPTGTAQIHGQPLDDLVTSSSERSKVLAAASASEGH